MQGDRDLRPAARAALGLVVREVPTPPGWRAGTPPGASRRTHRSRRVIHGIDLARVGRLTHGIDLAHVPGAYRARELTRLGLRRCARRGPYSVSRETSSAEAREASHAHHQPDQPERTHR